MIKTVEYKSFQIEEIDDCWGGQSYGVYKNDRLMFDLSDSIGEAKEEVDNYLGGDK